MHIIQKTRFKKTFCWRYTKYTRKLLSVSLKASVKSRTEGTKPLNDRWFDFTDELKHSELSHFTLQTSIQHKVKSQKGGLPAGQLGMFLLSPEDESRLPGTGRCCSTALMIPSSNFILKTIFCRSIQV